jgi:hypothetical protein
VVKHKVRIKDSSTVVSNAITIIVVVLHPPSNTITRATIQGLTQLRRSLILLISILRASSDSLSNNNSRVNIVLNPNSHQMATSKTPSIILRKE